MAYAPPTGNAIYFGLHGAYTPPAGDAINFNGGNLSGNPAWWRPGVGGEIRLPYGRGGQRDRRLRPVWGGGLRIDNHQRQPWGAPAAIDPALTSPWRGLVEIRHDSRLGWLHLAAIEAGPAVAWNCPPPEDAARAVGWDHLALRDRGVGSPFHLPPPVDAALAVPWGSLAWVDRELVAPYSAPPPNDRHHHTLWGRLSYARICLRRYLYPTGDAIVLAFHQTLADTGDGVQIPLRFEHLSYDLRCTHRPTSGGRDAYLYHRPEPFPHAPTQRVYIIMNNALLTRLPDRAPLDVAAMRLTTDQDSWCWGFEATLNSRAALDLVMPTSGGPVAVEAEINGVLWVVQVEGWRESKVFGRGGWTISGRSLSAQLAAPYARARSWVEDSAKTAVQLAEAELVNTGWGLTWSQTDWLVPAGAWSYQDLTPLEAIQRLANAAGGTVLTHVADQTLIVAPRYPVSPWAWGEATPALSIPDAMIRELGREWRPGPAANAVFVSGTNQGVVVRVLRDGSAGDLVAPDVADSLITEVAPGRERGRNILAAAGNWGICSLGLPLMVSPDLPGLLLPGTLLEINENSLPWRGQVRGVTISASRNNGLRVSQEVEVARYHG